MMNFRIAAFFPSVVLGLCLAFTPIHQADAKEAPAKVELKKSKTKAATAQKDKKSDKQKVAKKDKKTDTKKVAKNKKETKAKIAHAKQDKNRPKLIEEVRYTSKKAEKTAKNTAKSKEQRLAERKERTRERLAKISRTGKIAKVAKYTPKPAIIVAPRSPVVATPTIIQQHENISQTLNLESKAALVMNPVTGEVLYAKNTDKAVPIASITKLMTVMVVLDAQLPLDEAITISEADVDYLKNTNSRLQIGSVLSRAELMLLALMSSENRAAHALARTYTGGEKAAIAAMNRKAATLGMTQAHFEDGTGLSSHNVASPKDLVAMVKAANTYPLIRRFSTTGGHAIELKNAKLEFNNTNALVKNPDWEIGVSKTGYINEAGKCLVMQAKIKSTPVVIVLMDSWGKYTRIGDAVRVKKWLESSTN